MKKTLNLITYCLLLTLLPVNLNAQKRRIKLVVCQDKKSGRIIARQGRCTKRQKRLSKRIYEKLSEENKLEILELKQKQTTNAENISNLDAKNNTQDTSITNISAKVNKNKTDVASIKNSLDANTSSIATLNTANTAKTTAINDLQTTSGANTANISNLTSSVTSNSNTLSNLPNLATVYHVSSSGAPYTNIADAVSAASSDGVDADNPAIVLLAPETHTLTDMLTVPSGVTIMGYNTESTIIQSTHSIATVISLSSNSALKKITFIDTAGGSDRFLYTSGSNVVIEDIKFITSGASDTAFIWCNSSAQVLIKNLKARINIDSQNWSIIRADGNTELIIENTNIVQNQDGAYSTILYMSNSKGEIRNSYVEAKINGSSSVGGIPIVLNYSSTNNVSVVNSTLISNAPGTTLDSSVYTNGSGKLDIRNSKIVCNGNSTATLCVRNLGTTTLKIANSIIESTLGNNLIFAQNGESNIYFSELSGQSITTVGSGVVNCRAVVDENGVYSESSCP